MEKDLLEIIRKNVEEEPYAKLFGMKVVELKKAELFFHW